MMFEHTGWTCRPAAIYRQAWSVDMRSCVSKLVFGWMLASALCLAGAGSADAQGSGASADLPCNAFCRSYLGRPEPLSSAPSIGVAQEGETVVEAAAPSRETSRARPRRSSTASAGASASARAKPGPQPARTRVAARVLLPPLRPSELREASVPLPPGGGMSGLPRPAVQDPLSAVLPPIDAPTLPTGLDDTPASLGATAAEATASKAEPITRWAGTRRPSKR